MFHALRYESFDQQQHFEPREQYNKEEGKHIHLHVHLHLGSRTRARHASHPTVARVTGIFAAFMGALSMALTLDYQANVRDNIPTQLPLFTIANNLITAGTLLALAIVLIGGIPLVISAWRSTPRSRFLLFVPILTIGLAVLYNDLASFAVRAMANYGLNTQSHTFGNAVIAIPFYGIPLISTVALCLAMHRAKLSAEWLRLANRLSRLVVLGILMIFSGVALWGVALALFAPGWFAVLLPLVDFPWNSWLLIFLGTLIATIAALFALFFQTPVPQPRSPKGATNDT